MSIHTQTKQEIESRVLRRAAQDPTFRQRLLDDPKGVVSTFLGVALPPGMTLTVLEETPGQHYLVLPPAMPDLDALPLGDLDLALVGGGRTMRPLSNTCTIGIDCPVNSDTRVAGRGAC